MTDVFLSRSKADYGTAIVKYSAGQWDSRTKMLYMVGRKPDKYYAQYKDTQDWKDFLASQEAPENLPVGQLSAIAAQELALQIVDTDITKRLIDDIVAKIAAHPNRHFNSVRVAVPFPVDEFATTNHFAPAMAAAVTAALELRLPQALAKKGMPKLPVIADLGAVEPDGVRGILNIVNNQRGNTSNPNDDEKVATYMQRVVRQPVYSGFVDRNALYVPVDDFLVSQSTVAGLMSYIQSNGAVTTSALTGFKLFNGTEVLAPQQETLDFLKQAIHDLVPAQGQQKDQAVFEKNLDRLLNKAGLHIDFQDVRKTTLSNIELLFVAGYFADGGNAEHQRGFAKALQAVGATVDDAKGNSAYDVFNSKPGSLQELQGVFERTLENRSLMVIPQASRYKELENATSAPYLLPVRKETFYAQLNPSSRLDHTH